MVNLLTLRNFGFAGATDVFVFVAGYAATVFFGKMALERGFVVTTTRIFRRTWQLYAAYVVLFVIYIDIISNVAAQYATTDIIDEYNVTGIVDHPIRTLMHGLVLQAKPLNLDTLQLFVALMAVFPLRAVGDAAPAEPHACRIVRALRRRARRSTGACRRFRPGPGTSIRSAGSSSPCSARGLRSTARALTAWAQRLPLAAHRGRRLSRRSR